MPSITSFGNFGGLGLAMGSMDMSNIVGGNPGPGGQNLAGAFQQPQNPMMGRPGDGGLGGFGNFGSLGSFGQAGVSGGMGMSVSNFNPIGNTAQGMN